MKLLILYNSKIDPFGTHLAFSNSIAESASSRNHSALIIDIARYPYEAYSALTSSYFDAVHLEQSHGVSLIKKAIENKKITPPFFSLVRDMPFYPWIKDNIIPTNGPSKFFYVEPTAIEVSKKISHKHNGEYHPSLYTSSLLTEKRFLEPSKRPIRNLYVGSYQRNEQYLEKIKKHKKLSKALEIVLESSSTPAHLALNESFKEEIDFTTNSNMTDLCFLINQVARSIRREEFLQKISPQIPLTLVWNGPLPKNVRLHSKTKILKPKNYAQTVNLMQHSSNMWMMINNFGSALSERQLTSAASGCIPFSSTNNFSKYHKKLCQIIVRSNKEELEEAIENSKDDNFLDQIHRKIFDQDILHEFSPEKYIMKIEEALY